MISIVRKFLADRSGATAIIIALASIPMLVAAGAAVDFSRIASARAQLQFAVDSAALAGAGAFQTNKDGTAAYNVAKAAFNASAATLGSYASVTSTVGTSCNPGGAPNVTCGSKSASSGAASLCPPATIYCVQVTAQATLKNSLLGFLVPADILNAISAAQSTGTDSVGTGNFHHVGVGYGSDLSAIYAYAVPTDAAGNPEYDNMPPPNSNCDSSLYGPIQYLPSVPAANGVTTCNFVLIGENTSGSGNGNFSFTASDPLAFTFVNFTGGTITSGTSDVDEVKFNAKTDAATYTGSDTHYTQELYVTTGSGNSTNTTYNPTGETVSSTSGKTVTSTTLYAYCPAHNLYGSIIAYPNATNDIVPYQDSINTYSSAWEMLGWPPTHGTNHALLPFLGPANPQMIGKITYTVRAICPQWPVTGTMISATTSFSPSSLPAGYAPVTNIPGDFPAADNVPVYSTYYPDATYNPGSGTYPPAIAACTPATNASDGGVTPASDDPWWGWSPPNNTATTANGGGLTNCTATALNGGAITATQDNLQSTRYNNCAFLIQPLGTDVPSTDGTPDLPDYYTYTVAPTAFAAGTTGNPSNIISSLAPPLSGMTPVYDGIGNKNPAGYVPGSVAISGTGPYIVTEPPALGTNKSGNWVPMDEYPPEDTSHQCYDPQANGIDGSLLPGSDQPNNDSPVTPIDPVENPEYGAVLCDSNPPPSFALFWNDMGSWAQPPEYNDDLGYDNAVTEFTCPTPGGPGTSGPAALIY